MSDKLCKHRRGYIFLVICKGWLGCKCNLRPTLSIIPSLILFFLLGARSISWTLAVLMALLMLANEVKLEINPIEPSRDIDVL